MDEKEAKFEGEERAQESKHCINGTSKLITNQKIDFNFSFNEEEIAHSGAKKGFKTKYQPEDIF